MQIIRTVELVGKNCITPDDGLKLRQAIVSDLTWGNDVTVDFSGVEIVASPFLNVGIGALLETFSPADLNAHLSFDHLPTGAVEVLQRVIENAKAYFSNPKLRGAVDEAVGEYTTH